MSYKVIIMAGLITMVFIILACARRQVPPLALEGPAAAPEKPAAAAKIGWEAEWEQVQARARKEGTLVLYTGVGAEMRSAFAKALEKYGIELHSISGRGGELAEKIIRERRAGIYSVDMYISGATTIIAKMKPAGLLAPLEPLLILPEVKEPKMWYKGQLPFADEEKTLFAFAAEVSGGGIHVNSDIVKTGEINDIRDTLSFKWKGKIIMDDPTVPGRGNQNMAVFTIKLGEDFVKKLAEQKPVITRDRRQLADWLVKGRTPVGFGIYPDTYREYREAGAPIREILFDEIAYLTAGFGYVIYIDKAPHPNASSVFLNWFLSKEGQTIWDRVMESQSARVDVPLDHLKELGLPVRKPGMELLETTNEKWVLETKPKAEKIFLEYFAPLVK